MSPSKKPIKKKLDNFEENLLRVATIIACYIFALYGGPNYYTQKYHCNSKILYIQRMAITEVELTHKKLADVGEGG